VLIVCVVFFLIIIAVPHKPTAQAPRHAMEYRAEGLPFQERLYPKDKVSLPLEDDFIAITLESIDEKANFLTPFGNFSVGLNENTVVNASADQERLIITVEDYVPKKPQEGALVRFDVEEALSKTPPEGDITVSSGENPPSNSPSANLLSKNQGAESPPLLIFKSSNPHPFYVTISFMAPVFFRYEADKREWVENFTKRRIHYC